MIIIIVIKRVLILLSTAICIFNYSASFAAAAVDKWSRVSCPEKWINFEKSCYLLVRDAPVRWHEALKRCNETLAHLVSVNTSPEAEFLSKLLTETDLTRKVWLTSGYQTTDGKYEWAGDGNKFTFYFWHHNDNMEHGYVAYTYADDQYRWSTVKSTDVGYFICQIEKRYLYKLNDAKSRDFGLSPSESLNAPKAPRFVEEPSDTISYSNGPIHWVELRCTADADPPPTYKWYRGSSGRYVDPTSSTNVAQVDGNLLINQIVPSKDFGFYYCVASNDYGSIRSRKVALNSAYVKEFPSSRLDVYAVEGIGKSISCQAPDHFPQSMSFAWMYESVKQFLPETERIFVASDGTLYFSYLTKADQRKYSCTIVINELQAGHYGPFFTIKVDNANSNLHDLFEPNIPDEFPRIYPSDAQYGKSAWIECFAYGNPYPQYRWERLDKTLNTNFTFVKSFGRKLYFPFLTFSDAGTYRCIAMNSQGMKTKEISLTVQSAPIFLIRPDDVIVEINGTASLICEAFGSPRIEYEWFRNGKPLNPLLLPQDDQGRIVVDFNRLTIRQAALRDTGTYQCFAANSLGQITASANVLVKNFAATVAKEPDNQMVYAFSGTNVILPCRVEGLPKPVITWLYESRPINYGWQYALTKDGHLKILQVASVDSGMYTCTANNMYGSTSVLIQLKVLPSLQLEIEPIKPNTLNQNDTFVCKVKSEICTTCVDLPLDWTYNCQTTYNMQSYFNESRNISSNKLTVSSIVKDFGGILTCKTNSIAGYAYSALSIDYTIPPFSVIQVKAINVTHDSVVLTWQLPTKDYSVDGYKILCQYNNRTEWDIVKNWVEFSLYSADRYHVENLLKPNSFYQFSVITKNKRGWSRPSVPSNKIKTDVSSPFGTVEDLRVSVLRPGQFIVEWKPLMKEYWGADSIGYIVEWSLLNSLNSSQQSVTLGDDSATSYVLQTLDDFKTKNHCVNYSIRVRAFNYQGRGPAAGPVFTGSNLRLNIVRVQIDSFVGIVVNESSVNLSWSVIEPKSTDHCQQFLGYKIYYWTKESDKNLASVVTVSRNIRSAIISDLQSSTSYNFLLVPTSLAGIYNQSQIISLHTFGKAPQKSPTVTITRKVSSKENHIDLSWYPVVIASDEEQVLGYKIHLYETSSSLPLEFSVFAKDLSPSLPSIRLEQLIPFHLYSVQMQAYSKGGFGPLSKLVIFRFGLGSTGSFICCSSFVTILFMQFLLFTESFLL